MANFSAVILSKATQPWLTPYALELRTEPTLLNVPFMQWQVEALLEGGIAEVWNARLGAGDAGPCAGARIRHQAVPLGTGGALAEMTDVLGDGPVLACYGSAFIDASDVRLLMDTARSSAPGWGAIVAVLDEPPHPDTRETVNIDGEGQLHGVYRQHASVDRRRHRRLAGMILLSAEALARIAPGRYCDLKEQLFPDLLAAGLRIDTLATRGTFPVLTPEDFLGVQFDLLNRGNAANRQSGGRTDRRDLARQHPGVDMIGDVRVGEGCTIEPGARLIGPLLIGEGCHVGRGSTLIGPSVLGPHSRIGDGAVVHCSALANAVTVESGSQVHFSLLGPQHRTPAWTTRYYVDALCDRRRATMRRNTTTPRSGMRRIADAEHSLRIGLDLASKRILDVVVSAALLALTSPLWVVITIALRLDSPGPVFFRQRRSGQHGKDFRMMKFRTMVAHADSMQHQLRQANEVDGPMFKLAADPRITRVGAFLRRTSLDELPQLLNVLRGDMSLVGPRPLAMREMTLDPHWRDARLSVKPGITGPWQVYGRDSRNFHSWIVLDLQYVRRRSFAFDLKLLFMTAIAMFKGV